MRRIFRSGQAPVATRTGKPGAGPGTGDEAGGAKGNMQVVIHDHQFGMGPVLKAQLERDVRAFLGRFERWIRGVTVRIHSDAGEVTLATCCVLVDLHPGGGLGVQVTAPSPERALARAALRMRGILSEHLRRRQALPAGSRSGYGLLRPCGP